jgi:hypothetical protein
MPLQIKAKIQGKTRLSLSFLAFLIVIAGSSLLGNAQTTQRQFDNFDLPGGVVVITPAPPKPKQQPTNKRQGKYKVVVTDKLVKPAAQIRPTASVTDSLALREGAPTTASSLNGVIKSPVSPGKASSSSLKGFTTGNPFHDELIVQASLKFGLDPLLIYSQMHQESSFKTKAVSPKGASGLMQLMPATARRFGVTSIFDPKQNIEAGVRYMRFLLDLFNGDIVLALAAYNAGEGAVMKYGWQVPPYRETQEYVRRITARYSMITNGTYVPTPWKRSSRNLAKLEQKESRPLTIYEPTPITVRLPNGQLMLMNQ